MVAAANFSLAIVLEAIDRVSGPMGAAGAKLKKFGKGATDIGRKMTLGVTAPIAGAGAGVIALSSQFETAMNNVSALSGATGSRLKRLEDQALSLGRTTMFSASQAADGQAQLALAGLDVNQILTATPKILDFAAAANVDLATAAGWAIQVMKGQGKTEEQLADVTDVLIAGQKSAVVSVSELADGFSRAGATMKTFGVDMHETTATLAILNELGSKGSEGGSALQRVVTRLINPLGQARHVFKELNFELDEFQTPEGKFIGIANALRKLEAASPKQAMQIFGDEGGPAFLKILGQGADRVEELTGKVKMQGVTAEVAQIRMSGFRGQMLEFRAAVEGVAIAIGKSGLLEWATGLLEKGTILFQLLARTNPEILKTGTIIAGVVAVLGPMAIGIGGIATALGGLSTFLSVGVPLLATWATTLFTTVIPATWAWTAALLANPVTWVVAGVIALGAAIAGLIIYWDEVVAASKRVWDALVGWIVRGFEWVERQVMSLIDLIPDWLVDVFTNTTPIGIVGKAVGLFGDEVAEGGTDAVGAVGGGELARAETEIRIGFDNPQPGMRVTQDGQELASDELSMGLAMGAGA